MGFMQSLSSIRILVVFMYNLSSIRFLVAAHYEHFAIMSIMLMMSGP
jgi:hypothetical protein